MDKTLVILAAGMGSRYGGLKQMDAFGPNGETIIDYSIYDAIRAGFTKVVFIIRESFQEKFEAVFRKKLEGKVKLEFVTQELNHLPEGYTLNPERQKPWGTAHAVLVAEKVIDGPFAVINADDYYGVEAYSTLTDFFAKNEKQDYAVVSYYLMNTLSDYGTVNRGVCGKDEDGFLVDIVETIAIEKIEDGNGQFELDGKTNKLDKHTLVSMNMFGFYPDYFEKTKSYFKLFLNKRGNEEKSELFIPKVLDNMINEGYKRVRVLESPSSWFGVTYQDDKPFVMDRIQKLIDEGVYPKNLWD